MEEVPKKIEEALFFRLKQHAFERCRDYSRAYADCCRGRTISVVWSCRREMHALSDCMSNHTGKLDELKARWVAAGAPKQLDEAGWGRLLEGL